MVRWVKFFTFVRTLISAKKGVIFDDKNLFALIKTKELVRVGKLDKKIQFAYFFENSFGLLTLFFNKFFRVYNFTI